MSLDRHDRNIIHDVDEYLNVHQTNLVPNAPPSNFGSHNIVESSAMASSVVASSAMG